MHVLVTGGSGFIPSHIVDRLLQDGHKVRVLDLWQSEDSAIHNANTNFEFIKGDVLDDVLIKSSMKGIDRVIHMAAVLGTAETITTYDVEKVCMVNIIGTTKILKAAKEEGVGRVCIPTTPDVPWVNPYKITKAAVEKLCQLFSKEYSLEVVALKLGNIYGARERWLDGPKDAPYNYQKIIPTILMDVMDGKNFKIYGNGEQKSEYIYVDDVVEAFVRAILSEKNLGGEIIHVGCGNSNSVNEIVDACEKVWNRSIPREYVEMRPGEVHFLAYLDPKPMKKLLNYELQWNLEEGLVETIKYYEKMHARYKN